jgi:PPK2 family polyphosphate:nucleotide phosphotransferase
MMDRFRIAPGTKIKLDDWNPEGDGELPANKGQGRDKLNQLKIELDQLQEMLYAEHQHKVLVILQAMDTGGKDGTIRQVFEGVNPQGVRVASFKVPTPLELDHDYLWRVHQQVPARGEMVIFNRSHYEEVLVVRVHQLVPQKIWKRRYEQINQFEKMLAEEGTTILKFFLHISLDEQKKRLQDRLDTPRKQWKFNLGDLGERKLWPDYRQAYEQVLSRTSTAWAPWYIVPANRNWVRNLVVSSVLVETLKDLKMSYPPPKDDLSKVVIE